MRRGIFTLKRSGSRCETSPEYECDEQASVPASLITSASIQPLQATVGPTQLRSVLPAKDDSLRRRTKSRTLSTDFEVDLLDGSRYTPSPSLSQSSAMSVETYCPSPEPEPESPVVPTAPLAIPTAHVESFTLDKIQNADLISSFNSVGSSFAGDRTPCSPGFFFGPSSAMSTSSTAIHFCNLDFYNDVADNEDFLAVDRRGSGESVVSLDVFGLTLTADDGPSVPSDRIGSIDPLSPRTMRGRTHTVASLPQHMRAQSPGHARLFVKGRSPSSGPAKSSRRRTSLTPATSPGIRRDFTSVRIQNQNTDASSVIQLSSSPLAMSFVNSPVIPFGEDVQSSTLSIPPLLSFTRPSRVSTEPNAIQTGLSSALRGSRIKARSLAPLDLTPKVEPEPSTNNQARRPCVRFA